mgnify:FL=1
MRKSKVKDIFMRTKKGFRVNEICGAHVIVAEGEENIDFSDIISLNESALLLWNSVEGKDFTIDDLADILVNNYEIDENTPLPREVALKDAQELVDEWLKAGIMT